MEVLVRNVAKKEEERIVLECVEMTDDFQDIKEYAMGKGNTLTGYLSQMRFQIKWKDILYLEDVGEKTFAYTSNQVYSVKMSFHEVEQLLQHQGFARCSKTIILNLMQVDHFKGAMGTKLHARMKNGEDVVVTRTYAKNLRERMAEY
jgi:DNA-binding LytR/AlgR family response regulator